MLALTEITPWHWAAFVTAVVFFLALDLGVFHKKAHVVSVKEAMGWTGLWVTLSLMFAAGLYFWRDSREASDFLTGYIVELSLSMDNVFVIALIFSYFSVPLAYQHRVLFWGILGALIMRGVLIFAGAKLIERFHWLLYVLGAFLVFTGIKMVFSADEGVHPEKNPVLRLVRRFFPVTPDFEGQKFITKLNGRTALTPLALVLLMVETTDLIFAVDSIPAIFGITQKPFIIFTSNVFAILGLRSLYFLLAGAIGYFRYLKIGLSAVLVFIGIKMLIAPPPGTLEKAFYHYKIPNVASLLIVAGIITVSVVCSVVSAKRSLKD